MNANETDPGDTPQVQSSGRLSATTWCLRCENPSPMTLEGTNTWLLARGQQRRYVIIDPGPLDEEHLLAQRDHVAGAGGSVALIVLSHHHDDHTGGAQRLSELTGAPIRGAGRGEPFEDGEPILIDELDLRVLHTPGHTRDSISLVDPAEQVVYTGDTILGRGTTVVAHPDGDLGSYLASLDRLASLAASGAVGTVAPGHGPVNRDAEETIGFYRRHRKERLDQVRAALSALRATAGGDGEHGESRAKAGEITDEERADALAQRIVETVYADVPRAVWPAAQRSVRAQVDYLDQRA